MYFLLPSGFFSSESKLSHHKLFLEGTEETLPHSALHSGRQLAATNHDALGRTLWYLSNLQVQEKPQRSVLWQGQRQWHTGTARDPPTSH